MSRKPIRRPRPADADENTPAEKAAPKAEAKPVEGKPSDDKRRGRTKKLADHKAPKAPKRTSVKPKDTPLSPRLEGLDALAKMDASSLADMMGMGVESSERRPRPGTRLTGKVFRVGRDDLHIDLGLAWEGWMSRSELPEAVEGDEITAVVVSSGDHGIHLSKKLTGDAAEDFLEEAAEGGLPVEGVVTSRNKGGYTVKIGGTRAFCPISHIDRLPLADLDSVIGQTLAFVVIESGDKWVVSRKKLQNEELAEEREKFWTSALEGDFRDATVISVQPWGAFVDIDGVEGLLPRSEFGWDNVSDLTTRITRGQRMKVRLHQIRAEEGKLTVSTKDPELDPWRQVRDLFTEGAIVPGKVTRQAEFGVFVELSPGLEGLLHRSRLGKWFPKEGETIQVRIDEIDAERRRIALSPKDAPELGGDQDEDGGREWRQSQAQASAPAAMGTLGDLFSKLKK